MGMQEETKKAPLWFSKYVEGVNGGEWLDENNPSDDSSPAPVKEAEKTSNSVSDALTPAPVEKAASTKNSNAINTAADPAVSAKPVSALKLAGDAAQARADALGTGIGNAATAYDEAVRANANAYKSVPMRPLGFYEKLSKEMNPYTPPTAAEIQQQLKREKSQKIMAAIGDGISAMSNLFFTTQGALNAYDGNDTLSKRYADMYEKLRKDRDEKAAKYYQTYLQALGLDDANAERARSAEISAAGLRTNAALQALNNLREQQKYEQSRADRFNERDQAQQNWQSEFDRSGEQWQKTYDANREDARFSHSIQSQQLALSRQAAARAASSDRQKNYVRINTGHEVVDIPSEYLHSGTLQKLYDHVRSTVYGAKHSPGLKEKFDKDVAELKKAGTTYGTSQPLTDEDKLAIVNSYIYYSEPARNYLKNLRDGKVTAPASSGGSTSTSHKSDPYGTKGGSHKKNPYG